MNTRQGGNSIKSYQSLDEEEGEGPTTPTATHLRTPPFLSQHSTIDEEDDIIDEVMDRSDEGPAEAVYTSVRCGFEFQSIDLI